MRFATLFRSMPKMLQSSFNAYCQEEYFALFLLDAYVQMRAFSVLVRAYTSILRAYSVLVRAYHFLMRAFSVLVRANSVLMSVATAQNYPFRKNYPRFMANGSQTVVVQVVFAVIPSLSSP